MPLDDTDKHKLAEIAQALSSAGVAVSSTASASSVFANPGVQIKIASGEYFPITPQHAENYEQIGHIAREAGFPKFVIMLDVTDRGENSSVEMLYAANGEAILVANVAALKATPQLAKDLTDHQIEKGRFVELTPALAANFDEMASAATGFNQPARVVLDKFNASEAPIIAVEALGGVPIVKVNSSAHKWTVQFVKEHALLPSDAETKEGLESGKLHKAELTGVSPQVLEQYAVMSQKMGIKPPPALYQRDVSGYSIAAANVTKEGSRLVLFSKEFLLLSQDAQNAVLAHELAHHVLGHMTTEKIVLGHNISATRRQMELAADALAAKILCAPHHMGAALQETIKSEFERESKQNPDLTKAEIYDKITPPNQGTHPSTNQRLGALQELAGQPMQCDNITSPIIPKRPVPHTGRGQR